MSSRSTTPLTGGWELHYIVDGPVRGFFWMRQTGGVVQMQRAVFRRPRRGNPDIAFSLKNEKIEP